MIATTILLSIAVTLLIWSIIDGLIINEFWFIKLIIGSVLGFIGVAILYATPTNKDVREGEAHYIEQNHIEVVNGDTINNYKTYQIVWIENSK